MIIAYVYDFPHFKSSQGLFALKRAGYDDVIAVGAPWRRLNIKESRFQFRTADMRDAHHPAETCKALGYRYYAHDHDSDMAEMITAEADHGLLLGARILKPRILNTGTPIVNLHPGTLPHNRGLDTLKWAVHDDLPQAITAHVIDERIDRGQLLHEQIVSVYPNDSFADIYNRMMWAQIDMIGEKLFTATSGAIEAGTYRKPMTLEQDVETVDRFAAYKHNYCKFTEGLKDAA